MYVPLCMTRLLLCFRYFTEEAATLGCMIFGVRDSVGPGQVQMRDYWIPDGLYGSMNSLLYDHAVLSTHPLGATPGPLNPISKTLPFKCILREWLLLKTLGSIHCSAAQPCLRLTRIYGIHYS